jgi:phosphonate transport system permease protein
MSTPPKNVRPQPPSKARKTISLILTAVLFLVAAWLMDAKWGRLSELPGAVAEYTDLMLRGILENPTEEPTSSYWNDAIDGMLDSLYMAWIGTLIGAMFSFPLGFLAAENVSPKPVVLATRQVLNAIRAVPELILVIVVMMPIFGLGPLAGGLALGVHSIGTLGKLTAEVIEGVDSGPIEAARAVGASRFEVLRWGVVPQALPETIAFWLYRFEINIRAGAVLGVVGAGGIGSVLARSFGQRQWDRIGVTILVIIVLTIIIDNLSAQVRRRVISGREITLTPTAA